MPFLSPEAYTLLGILGGGAVTGAFAWLGHWTTARTDRHKSDLDYSRSQIASLQEQNNRQATEIAALRAEMRALELSIRSEREEAWDIQDRARLAISLAVGYIHLLQSHISSRKPPPYPHMPEELERYISLLLWDSPRTGGMSTRAPPEKT
jgi:hypothetical protein